MKSIWSKNYIPFKSSTPFGNLIIQNKINRPNTLGIAKAIASPFDNKRKIEHVKKESNSQYTSSASSSADSDYITDENDYTESDKKRLRTDALKVDIDNLLNDYCPNVNKISNLTDLSPSGKAFNFKVETPSQSIQSPIVNKNSEKRNGLLSNLENSPLCVKQEVRSSYFSSETNTKDKKSNENLCERFSVKKNKFAFNSPHLVIADTPEKKDKIEETKTVVEDLELVYEAVKSKSPIERKLFQEKTSTTSKQNNNKANKKLVPTNQPSVMDLFSRFACDKSSNKLGRFNK